MTETLANVGPIMFLIGIGWIIVSLVCIVLTSAILDDEMEPEDYEKAMKTEPSTWREHGNGSTADPRLR